MPRNKCAKLKCDVEKEVDKLKKCGINLNLRKKIYS